MYCTKVNSQIVCLPLFCLFSWRYSTCFEFGLMVLACILWDSQGNFARAAESPWTRALLNLQAGICVSRATRKGASKSCDRPLRHHRQAGAAACLLSCSVARGLYQRNPICCKAFGLWT